MKFLLFFLLASTATLGGIYGYYSLRGSVPAAIALPPGIPLAVVYPANTPDGSLTPEQTQSLRAYLTSYPARYQSVTLYINHYPPQSTSLHTEQANFQLIFTMPDGSIYESRRMYTLRDQLARKIKEKISTAMQLMGSPAPAHTRPMKVAF